MNINRPFIWLFKRLFVLLALFAAQMFKRQINGTRDARRAKHDYYIFVAYIYIIQCYKSSPGLPAGKDQRPHRGGVSDDPETLSAAPLAGWIFSGLFCGVLKGFNIYPYNLPPERLTGFKKAASGLKRPIIPATTYQARTKNLPIVLKICGFVPKSWHVANLIFWGCVC